MKILLDECVTKRLKPYLLTHEVFTVSDMRWNGLKNGALLSQCAVAAFELLLTIDKNISTQQNIAKSNLIVIVFNSFYSKLEELIEFIPQWETTCGPLERVISTLSTNNIFQITAPYSTRYHTV